MKTCLILLFFWTSLSLSAADTADKPLSVVIIGGGPAGLATAIEARLHGAEVIVIEKNLEYSRSQTLFLFNDSVSLIEKWDVKCPQMAVYSIDEKSRIAFVRINDLEKNLAKRARELGVRVLQGEFLHFVDEALEVKVRTKDSEAYFPYDILIGADGTHSQVRDKLDIKLHDYGKATGAVAIVGLANRKSLSIETDRQPKIYIRRILTPPSLSILFAQGECSLGRISYQDFAQAARTAGWNEEADKIENRETVVFIDRINVVLQQVQTFSNGPKAAILVGDSAASASFFEGRGVNSALKTAALAGHFIADIQAGKKEAYASFNMSMKKTTDLLIDNSRYLFNAD